MVIPRRLLRVVKTLVFRHRLLDEDGVLIYHSPTSKFHVESVDQANRRSLEVVMAGTDFRVKEAHLRILRTQHEPLKRVWGAFNLFENRDQIWN